MSNWQGNFQIKISSSDIPLTSHGPALAVFGSRLYMTYVGKNGANLWFSYLENGNANFTQWQGNEQIKVGTHAPQASYRPALAVLNGVLHMVYVGHGGSNLWWSWYDGKAWQGNVELVTAAGTMEGMQPALAAFSGKLYLVYGQTTPPVFEPDPANPNAPPIVIDPARQLLFYSAFDGTHGLAASSWQLPESAGADANLAALSVFNGKLYMFASAASEDLVFQEFSGNAWQGWHLLQTGAQLPQSSGGAAIAPFGSSLSIVYPGKGGENLWYSTMDVNNVGSGNMQVLAGSSPPKTSAPISCSVFGGALCVAYKGAKSNDLWMSWLP